MTIETGLSDCHKMTVTAVKMYIKKKPPRRIHHRCYKNYKEDDFRNDLLNSFEAFDEASMNYQDFHEIFIWILSQHAEETKDLL